MRIFCMFFFMALLCRFDSSLNLDEIFTMVKMKPIEIVGKRIDPNAVVLLARLLHCEAGNQEPIGQLAVATVVLNRAQQRTDLRSLKQVIYAPGQFDGIRSRNFWGRPSSITFLIAREALGGMRAFGKEILFFHNPKVSTDSKWVRKMSKKVRFVIGQHAFAQA